MNNILIKHFIVGLIIFSNFSFGKEFSELFTIYEPIENSTKIDKSINSSFNNMVYRLSGTNSPSNVWKIINSGASRKEFIISYAIKNIEDLSYLQVKFDQDLLISKFNDLAIPMIGYSRPVIFFLIEIDSGTENPYYLSSNQSEKIIDIILQNALNQVSKSRGLFLELPVFDLVDKKNIANISILTDTEGLIASKYKYDVLKKIKLINNGLNEWSFTGDINQNIAGSNFQIELQKKFIAYIESLADQSLSELKIDTSEETYLYLSILGVTSYDDYIRSRDELNRFIAVSDIEIISFKNKIITYKVNVKGSVEALKNEVEANNFLDNMSNNKNEKNLNLLYQK